MTYEIADEMGADLTYGWLVAQVTSGGPADDAGIQARAKERNKLQLPGSM